MIQIPKIVKILISILIAISIAVTPFATGFNVKSEAVIPITGNPVGDFILDGIIGGALYWAFEEIGEDITFVSNSAKEAFYSSCNGYTEHVINAAEDNGYIVCTIDYNAGSYLGDYYCHQSPCTFAIKEGVTLSAEEQYFYNTLISELNAAQIKPIYNTLTSSYMVDTNTYENIKSAVVNTAIKEYAEVSKADLGEALGDGAIPTYNFDFVGPMPTLELPTLNKYGAFVQEGYYHSLPITIDPSQKVDDSFYYIGEAQSSALVNLSKYNGAKLPLADYVSGNQYFRYGLGAYGSSQYILHDGKIYYACINNGFYDGGCNFYDRLGYIISPDLYIAADGTRLSSTDFDANSSFQMGYVANIDGVYKGANPAYAAMNESATTAPTEGDFTTTTGGAISIPKTIAETVIGNAIEMGLLNPDSVLGINENGEIVSADGIELAKLQEMVDGIAAGNLELENIEEYLSLISKLITSGNLTAKEHTALLESIKTSTAAISAVIATKGKVEIDTPDVTIIDKFPFCLPFDLYYVFSLLCTEAKEPVFTVPIKTTIKNGGLNYSIDEEIVLDLTCFKLNGYDMVQIFTQSTTMLLFIVCLISATKKLMWS